MLEPEKLKGYEGAAARVSPALPHRRPAGPWTGPPWLPGEEGGRGKEAVFLPGGLGPAVFCWSVRGAVVALLGREVTGLLGLLPGSHRALTALPGLLEPPLSLSEANSGHRHSPQTCPRRLEPGSCLASWGLRL